MNKEILAEMIVTQRHFRDLYNSSGLIGIGRDYIQVTKEAFAKIKDLGEIKVEYHGPDYDCPYQVSVEYRGVKFLAVGTVLEFDAIGINVL